MGKISSENLSEIDLTRCASCNRLRGKVKEKYNGLVIVACRCDLSKNPNIRYKKGWAKGRLKGPLIVSNFDDSLWWCATTDYIGEDRKSWHVPWFGSP